MNFSVILSLIVTPHLPEVYYSRDQLLTLRSTPAVTNKIVYLYHSLNYVGVISVVAIAAVYRLPLL